MPTYRFGKHPPKLDYRTLRFKDYLTPALTPPPPSYNVLTRVYQGVQTSDPTVLFPVDGNDTLGDCTIAGVAHAITVFRGLVRQKTIASQRAVVAQYEKLTGGPDTGLNELDVLKYWRKQSMLSDKILAFVSVDPKNHTHVEQAIRLFGGVYLGFQVQQNCVQQFNDRQPWTPGPLTKEGHAVFAVEYDQHGVTVLTWGNTQVGTWQWWNECVDEAFAVLPPEAGNPDFAPGFNVKQLLADLAQV